MNITFDKIRVEGNSIFIRSNPTIGILALTAFSDTTTGEDGTHIFTKVFRYSKNGITFSDWFDLTALNITSIQVNPKDTLIIELHYLKDQPGGDDVLQFNSASIDSTDATTISGFYFNNSIFKSYFDVDNLEVLNWQINVLDKLFQRGLLPTYIERLDEFENPDDFIEFWRSITKFFAYYVTYARTFQKFYESEVLLSEYLEERGMQVSPLNTLNELNFLMENFYKEIFHRGTTHIIDKKSNNNPIDGELLRLIQYKSIDEFIFNLYKPEHFGWNLGNSSPMYRGMRINDNANKFYEPGMEVVDKEKYPVTAGFVEVKINSGHSTLHFSEGGLTSNNDSNTINQFKIVVDPFLDYELFFMIKVSPHKGSEDTPPELTVGFEAFDKDLNLINLKSHKNGTNQNFFIRNAVLQRSDKYIGVSLFLYNKLKPNFQYDTTRLNIGEDLRMTDEVNYVIPNILVEEGEAYLYYMRLTPMRTSYSRGFMDTKNFISAWIKNNNNKIDILAVKQYIKKYLIPYNSNIELSTIVDDSDYGQEIVYLI